MSDAAPDPRSAARGPGRGNGLAADSYVMLTEVDPRVADALLRRLAAAGVAAYAVPSLGHRGSYLEVRLPPRPVDRVYVDARRRDAARAVLAAELPFGGQGEPADRDVDAAFAAIVAGWQQDEGAAAGPHPWPAAEDLPAPPPAGGPAPGATPPTPPAAPGPPRRRSDQPPATERRAQRAPGSDAAGARPDTGTRPPPAPRPPGADRRGTGPGPLSPPAPPQPSGPVALPERPGGVGPAEPSGPAGPPRSPGSPPRATPLPAPGARPPSVPPAGGTAHDGDRRHDGGPDDVEHYRPPPAPPLPRPHPVTRWALAAIVLGMLVLAAPTLLSWSLPQSIAVVAVLCVVGGVGVLVARMADRPGASGDGPDDGAVV